MRSDRGSGRRTHTELSHLYLSRIMSALNAIADLPDPDYQFLQRCKANLLTYGQLDRFPKQIWERQQQLLQLADKYEITIHA